MTADKASSGMLAVCTAILVAGALYLGRSIFSPVAFSIFTIAIVWPMQRALQRKVPKLVALILTILVTLAALTLLALGIAWGSSQIGHWLLGNLERFALIYSSTNQWLEAHGIFLTQMLVDRFDAAWLLGFARQVAPRLNALIGFGLLVFAFTILGLVEIEQVKARVNQVEQQHSSLRLSIAAEQIAKLFRKYILIRSLASILTGFATFCFALIVGLELALAWGTISFVLNYIPFLGPLLAVVLATMFAAAQFETLQMALTVLIGLSAIQFSIGSYIEPRLAGATLAMSPFLVLFAVFFWSLLWGIPGAFIGVPMMIALLTICDQYGSSRWLPTLLSDSGPPRA